MLAMPTTIEGTWEEISRHAKQFQGRKLRLTIVENDPLVEERLAFLRLPMEERDKILAYHAERLKDHYEKDTEWREFGAGDILDVTERTAEAE